MVTVYCANGPELGQGTTFRMYVLVSSGVSEVVKTDSRPCSGGEETILVAEDHEALQAIARETLEARGYQVIVVSDGAEAVRVFKASWDRIRLVILDVPARHPYERSHSGIAFT